MKFKNRVKRIGKGISFYTKAFLWFIQKGLIYINTHIKRWSPLYISIIVGYYLIYPTIMEILIEK